MREKVCYLGDGSLTGAASYLAAIMLNHGIAFDHVPSSERVPASFGSEPYALYVASDYPAEKFGDAVLEQVAECVEKGSGLLMIGGWESFYGRLGEYHDTALAEVLPVVMQSSDDRRNFAQPCLVEKAADHPTVDGLPWDRPPGIGGINAIAPKPGAKTILNAVQFAVRQAGGEFTFDKVGRAPLLIVGRHGEGRTAALATDVAPHWVGGMVDWGDRRVAQNVVGETVEVGNWYATFFRNLLKWTGNLA